MQKIKKAIPYSFILDLIRDLDPYTKPMFGCTAVYVEEKIIFILRKKEDYLSDNGVWIATHADHHSYLRKIFPSMRSIQCLAGGRETNWQIIPEDSDNFEEYINQACELVLKRDPCIGKVPKRKKPKPTSTKKIRRKKSRK